MDIMDLQVKNRIETGSRKARNLRRNGSVPAILYGHGMQPMNLEVNARELHRVLHTKAGENVVINLKVEGAELKESTCRFKDISHDPVTDKIAHVDFTVISLTEKIAVQVPVVVKNAAEAAGVKEGGVLDIIHHEIEIECLPTEIPEKFEYDVKALNINDTVHVRDLNIPSNFTVSLEPDEAVIAIHPPSKEEEKAPEGEVTEPEVIEKGKKPEEGEEGAPAPAKKEEKKAEAPKEKKA